MLKELEKEIKNFVNEVRTSSNWPNKSWNPTPWTRDFSYPIPNSTFPSNWPSELLPVNGYFPKTTYNKYETNENFYLTFDLPGYGKDSLTVEITDNVLTIEGKKEVGYGENSYTTSYNETVYLTSFEYDSNKTSAEIKNGVLTVTLPKYKKDKRKTVTLI
jgi:HSP20 family molecular chaperone IbpA